MTLVALSTEIVLLAGVLSSLVLFGLAFLLSRPGREEARTLRRVTWQILVTSAMAIPFIPLGVLWGRWEPWSLMVVAGVVCGVTLHLEIGRQVSRLSLVKAGGFAAFMTGVMGAKPEHGSLVPFGCVCAVACATVLLLTWAQRPRPASPPPA